MFKTLNAPPLTAHHRGDTWATFWQEHGKQVRQAEPHDRGHFRRLVDRLLCIVVSGDDSGMEAAGDVMPWTVDNDAGEPADVDRLAGAGIGPILGVLPDRRARAVSHLGRWDARYIPVVTS